MHCNIYGEKLECVASLSPQVIFKTVIVYRPVNDSVVVPTPRFEATSATRMYVTDNMNLHNRETYF